VKFILSACYQSDVYFHVSRNCVTRFNVKYALVFTGLKENYFISTTVCVFSVVTANRICVWSYRMHYQSIDGKNVDKQF